MMNSTKHLPILKFFIDDSGTRHPDKFSNTNPIGDWFALGGILIKEEDEKFARQLHSEFCIKWKIAYPLHSVKIRHKSDNFSWLATLSQKTLREFFGDLEKLVLDFPAVGHACVIDRPKYRKRYEEKHGRQQWQLCKTSFSVVCERAAKYAAKHNRRIRLYAEKTDKKSDQKLRDYFAEMRDEGMPFSNEQDKYGPMSPIDLKFRLIELRFKDKNCPLTQMADIFLYPICRSGYDDLYAPLKAMRENKKLIEQHLTQEEIPTMGVKYSCFGD